MIRLRRYASIAAIGLAAVSLGGYLWFSLETYGLGLPLDDAWIHQTYARNLAERGEWAFVPGEASGGSTAPLWTVLLAGGVRPGGRGGPGLGAEARPGACVLGTVALAGGAAAAVRLFRPQEGQRRGWVVWLGIL